MPTLRLTIRPLLGCLFAANLASFSRKRGRSSTSGLTTFSGTSPLAARIIPWAISRPVACQTSEVDADQCGVRITLSSPSSGSSIGNGSTSKTSSPAPAILRSRSASAERLLVDQLAPADVDEVGRWFHQARALRRRSSLGSPRSAGNAGSRNRTGAAPPRARSARRPAIGPARARRAANRR